MPNDPQQTSNHKLDFSLLAKYSKDSEWRMRNQDGVEYGPYSWGQLIQFAKEGRISISSELQNTVSTKGKWVRTERIKRIADLILLKTEQTPSVQAPPISTSVAPPPAKDLFEAIQSTNRKQSQPKASHRSISINTVFLGLIVILLACIALPIIFWSSVAIRTAKSLSGAKHPGTQAESCKIMKATVHNSFLTADYEPDPYIYRFEIALKNQGSEIIRQLTLQVRAIRDNRPVGDYETTLYCDIKGGCAPGETVTTNGNIRCKQLRGSNVLLLHSTENNAKIQVSIDEKQWVAATMVGLDQQFKQMNDRINNGILNAL